ncbi:MAG: type II secretion system protein [Magnetococcales bacterium]|nr:type II secretion system protein [Magnetococcales bacterium]
MPWRTKPVFHGMDRQSGVTLIELIMVMVIMGILAVYIGARWQGDLSFPVKVDQLVNDIRRAQALAMSKDGNYRIENVGSDSYRIVDASGVAVDPQPTQLEHVTFPTFAFTFNGRGAPVNGNAEVTTNQELQLTSGTEALTIRIIGYTGLAQRL